MSCMIISLVGMIHFFAAAVTFRRRRVAVIYRFLAVQAGPLAAPFANVCVIQVTAAGQYELARHFLTATHGD